jgi:hypothetical protein
MKSGQLGGIRFVGGLKYLLTDAPGSDIPIMAVFENRYEAMDSIGHRVDTRTSSSGFASVDSGSLVAHLPLGSSPCSGTAGLVFHALFTLQ